MMVLPSVDPSPRVELKWAEASLPIPVRTWICPRPVWYLLWAHFRALLLLRASEENTWNHDNVSRGQSKLSSADDECWRSFLLSPYTPCFWFRKVAADSGAWLDWRAGGKKKKGKKGEEKLIFLVCFLTPNPARGALWAPKILSECSCWRKGTLSTTPQRQAFSCPHTPTGSGEHVYEYISKPEWVIFQPPAATPASGLTHFLQLRCGSNNPRSALHLA